MRFFATQAEKRTVATITVAHRAALRSETFTMWWHSFAFTMC